MENGLENKQPQNNNTRDDNLERGNDLYPMLYEYYNTAQNAQKERDKIEQESYRDPVTGLPNGKYFQKAVIDKYNDNSDREYKFNKLAIIYTDANGLKFVNDNYDHDAGDAYLKAIANFLEDNFREEDVVYRLHDHGDEFAVVCQNSNTDPDFQKHMEEKIEKLKIKVGETTIEIHNKKTGENDIIPIGFAIGMSIYHDGSEKYTISDAVKTADHRMQEHKEYMKKADPNHNIR